MALQLVTDAIAEPITLSEAKAHCRIDTADEDALVTSYIGAARRSCEDFCNRAFLTQTWRLVLDEFPLPKPMAGSAVLVTQSILIPKAWVRSISSVKYIDAAGTEQTCDASNYRLVAHPHTVGRLMPAFGLSWPAVRADEGVISVEFVAGWTLAADVPETIKQAIKFMVGHFYQSREEVVIGTIATQLPRACEHLLWPHRVFP